MTLDLQVFFARLKIGDLRQHQVQKAAGLTRLTPSPHKRAGKVSGIVAIESASETPSTTES